MMEKSRQTHFAIFLIWFVMVTASAIYALYSGRDYVGPDNDDVMRLVQIRDLMAGQNWFDLTQYRLGLDGGTLLHWSRLVDLPILLLIALFSLFLSPVSAEAAALYVWPSLLVLPAIYGIAKAGALLSPKFGGLIGAIGAAAYIFGTAKFTPGAIDHHNVQIVLIAMMLPILIAPTPDWRGFGLAGILSAIAIAIGAETTPLIAMMCMIVALNWAFHGGKVHRRPTRIFALTFSVALTLIFFISVPSQAYLIVVCDALSFGYYALGVIGAAGLFLAAALLSYQSRMTRMISLCFIGAVVLAASLVVAPQCLQSPLADLDPLLNELWLKNVTEAKSFWAMITQQPTRVLGFYMVPIIAIIICLFAIYKEQNRNAHIKLLALLCVAFIISLIQVRGSIFSNLIAMVPLIGWVSNLRQTYVAHPKDSKAALSFLLAAIISLPIVWTAFGAYMNKMTHNPTTNVQSEATSAKAASASAGAEPPTCTDEENFQMLADLPTGLVATASNLGVRILRFTDHRTLSAPYHRNQDGMLAELNIAMAEPEKARQIALSIGVDYVVFCKMDAQTNIMRRHAPNGLYAQLADGKVPAFLKAIDTAGGPDRPDELPVQIYRVE